MSINVDTYRQPSEMSINVDTYQQPSEMSINVDTYQQPSEMSITVDTYQQPSEMSINVDTYQQPSEMSVNVDIYQQPLLFIRQQNAGETIFWHHSFPLSPSTPCMSVSIQFSHITSIPIYNSNLKAYYFKIICFTYLQC